MKIKRLYIGDMGIYRNSIMENISSKIVVIGGLNRSGKTTFLDILRNMPYGFSKNLRPATLEYFLECDLENEDKEKISVRINGLREPQVSFKEENRNKADKLYGEIDKFTYNQLYTITLDELKKLTNKSEEEKLQAVLLGAGINDIVHIPKLIENIKKDKEKIGGKNGSPNIKLFKPYYEKILTGVKEREIALEQLEEYSLKKEELDKINQDILLKEVELDSIKDQTLVLEVLVNYFDDYSVCNSLKNDIEILKEQNLNFDFVNLPPQETVEALYEEYCEVYKANNEALNFNNGYIKGEDNCIELLKYEDKIRYHVKNISGLKHKLLELKTLKSDFEQLNDDVLKKMTNINSKENEDYNNVLNIECDLISEDKLMGLSEDMKYAKEINLQCKEELEVENQQVEALKREIKALKNDDIGASIKSYLIASFGILAISILIFFVNKALASGLFITGVTSTALYYFIKQGRVNQINNQLMNLELQLKTNQNKQNLLLQKLEKTEAKEVELKNSYNVYKEKLLISEEITPQGLLLYFKNIKELKHSIINLKNLMRKIDEGTYNVNCELMEIYNLVGKFIKTLKISGDMLLSYSDEIFQALEVLDKEIDNAKYQILAKEKLLNLKTKLIEKLNLSYYDKNLSDLIPELIKQYKVFNSIKELHGKLQSIEKNIIKNLSSDRIEKAFKIIGRFYGIDKTETIDYFYSMLNIYPVKIEIKKEIDLLDNRMKQANYNLDELKERLQIIKLDLNNLSTSDKLLKSQRLIDEGRLNLKPLAVKFSVLSAAEYILETVQKDFLDNARYKLLKGASEIFSNITSGEYKTILPGDNLLQSDYKTVEEAGDIEEISSMLSRGTVEQLYLSVRLNRIKGIKQKLPIIFDDPFVNFDDIHVKNTLNLIADLAEDNQIFILTCHAEVIKHISDIKQDVQYWKLTKGKFDISNSGELIKHLTKI